MMELNSNSVIGIVGSGAMGSGIAQVAAMAGHKVFVYDSNSTSLQKDKQNLTATLLKLVEKQKITQQKSDEVSKLVSFVDTIESLSPCNLVIEAIVENLDVKKTVFSHLDKITGGKAIL